MAKTTTTKDKKKRSLNSKQELFCQHFATNKEVFGNGVDSYMLAYGPIGPNGKPLTYMSAKTNAWRLLTNADILARIDELMDIYINDQVVDKNLGIVVLQNADFSSKVAAIREYNKLKGRIIEKKDITSGGKPIPILNILSDVQHNDSDQKDKPVEEADQSDTGGDISQ